jgi:ferredoxin
MTEVEIEFEREKRSGIIAVGSYLFDAARRLGIEVEAECERRGECDSCAMRITTGVECLSETTEAEIKQLTAKRRKNGERLSCQTKIEKFGEILVMTNKKKEEEKPSEEEKSEAYRKEFEDFPLEKKVANLVQLEAITLGETFSFVINSPSLIVGKIMDVMAEFGLKLEDDAKKAARPVEHKTGHEAEDEQEEKAQENHTNENTQTPPKDKNAKGKKT